MLEKTCSLVARVAAIYLLPRAAQACPFCDSSTSQLVWDGIFDERFISRMTMSLAPFALFAVLGIWLHGPRHHPGVRGKREKV